MLNGVRMRDTGHKLQGGKFTQCIRRNVYQVQNWQVVNGESCPALL